MFEKVRHKFVLAGLGLLVGGAMLAAPMAEAGSRYSTQPPVVLSPDLTEPWQLQLTAPGRAKVVTRSSKSFAHDVRKSKRVTKKRAAKKRVNRAYTTSSLNVGSALRNKKKSKPRYSTKQRSSQLPKRFLPQIVEYNSRHKPGTVVIDTKNRFLYLVIANGEARRYGVGVGKQGFGWTGTERVSRKAEWPSWRPPAQMIARERAKGRILPAFMPGGVKNPMGARGIYLGSTLYRIHGTNAPWTIGQAVSSGCFRMRNEDVQDLYPRVRIGTKVVVI